MGDLEGTVLKGYRLTDRIGSGGFGAVYRADQSTIGREVAVKVILPGFANQPEFIRRFDAEAQMVARLEHMHITPLYDYWRDPDGAYLVMRYLRGGSLADALVAGPYQLEDAANLLEQVASALAVAHRNGVIHRDIKPSNILLDEDGNAYLADFGIAKDLGRTGTALTQQKDLVGSPDYLAPEQARSEAVTPQTDIYSLGVVLYEVLTGEHPFPGLSPVERLFKHINESLPRITILEPEVADAVNAVVQRATAKNPTHRYEHVLAMARGFREAAGIGASRADSGLVELLTPREQEVLKLIVDGHSNREIAQALTIELATVKWYASRIYRKLKVRSRVQAIVRARELNLIVEGFKASASETDTLTLPEPRNPYKGLRPFQPADEQDFFGRETLVDRLINRLAERGQGHRFLAIVGPSGSGKSSLIKAGLIPALWRGDLEHSERWYIAELVPGGRPLDELEVALTRVASERGLNLREQLQRDRYGLARAAGLILPDEDGELLLVIDQFEELFTLTEQEAYRTQFLDLLHAAATDPKSRVRIVIALRADFYDRPLQYPNFAELLRTRMETVLPLSAEELEQAIRSPAEAVQVEFEDGLVARIVSEVHYQPGALPLLQYSLTELFDSREDHKLTHEGYERIGGSVGALAKRAEEAYAELDDRGKEAARQVLLRLVTLGEGVEDTRRRANRSELLAINDDPDLADEVIDSYTAYRLLSTDQDPLSRSPTVEIAHEALIREWDRLARWLDESRADVRMQRQLARAAADWREAGEDVSFLLRGSRLEQFAAWEAETRLALTPGEREVLEASLEQSGREERAERERQLGEQQLALRARNRLRALVGVFGVAAAVAAGLALFATNQTRIAEAERDTARALGLAFAAREAALEDDPDLALALAVEANRIPNDQPLVLQTLSESAYAPGTMAVYAGHGNQIVALDVSPDGRYLLSGSGRVWPTLPVLEDNTMRLWEVESGEQLQVYEGHADSVKAVAFARDGETAFSASFDNTVIHWDLDTGNVLHRYQAGESGHLFALEVSPDGSKLLIGGIDNADGRALVRLIDLGSWRVLHDLSEYPIGPVQVVAFAQGGRIALAGGGDTVSGSRLVPTLMAWDTQSGEVVRRLELHEMPGEVKALDLSPDGRAIVIGITDFGANWGVLLQWNIETWEEVRRFEGDYSFALAAAFSPNGETILSSSWFDVNILWKTSTGEEIRRLVGHGTGQVWAIGFAPDGQSAFTASADSTVRRWSLSSGLALARLDTAVAQRDELGILALAVSPDGMTAVTSGVAAERYGLTMWNPSTGEEIRRYLSDRDGRPCEAHEIVFSPDGTYLWSASGGWSDPRTPSDCEQFVATQWEVSSGREVGRVGEGMPIYDPTAGNCKPSIGLSPDGQYLLVPLESAGVGVLAIDSGELVRSFAPTERKDFTCIQHFDFSPDGTTLVTAMHDHRIVIWDWESGEQVAQIADLGGIARSTEFSPDGRNAVAVGDWGPAILLNTETWEIERSFGSGISDFTMAFSPGGDSFLTGTWSFLRDMQLWDLKTGLPLLTFTGHTGLVLEVAFGPEGDRAYSVSEDGTFRIWEVVLRGPQELIEWTLANRYVAELTDEQREFYGLAFAD